jgi:hypothetical protein
MKAYAHPIKDENGETTGWCNEPKGQTKEKEFTYSPEKSDSIERQVSAKIAFDHNPIIPSCSPTTPTYDKSIEDILVEAEKIYNWIHRVKPTVTAVKDTIKGESKIILAGDLVSETELSSEPITAEQKKRLKELQEKLPGRALQLIKEWGWDVKAISKLTKGQAKHLIDVLVAETVIKEGAKNEGGK